MNRTDLLTQCSVAQPEVTRLCAMLEKYGMPKDVVDVEEAYQLLSRRLKDESQ
jgi:hypothetical protein